MFKMFGIFELANTFASQTGDGRAEPEGPHVDARGRDPQARGHLAVLGDRADV